MDEQTLMREYRPVYPLPNHLMIYVRHDQCGPDAEVPKLVVVAGECTVTHEFYILEGVPLRGLSAWRDEGQKIHEALPGLTPAAREFIKSGIRPGGLTPRG